MLCIHLCSILCYNARVIALCVWHRNCVFFYPHTSLRNWNARKRYAESGWSSQSSSNGLVVESGQASESFSTKIAPLQTAHARVDTRTSAFISALLRFYFADQVKWAGRQGLLTGQVRSVSVYELLRWVWNQMLPWRWDRMHCPASKFNELSP